MSYYAPDTPNPTDPTQIGYSYPVTLTTLSVNTSGNQTTTITNVPIGVWMITSPIANASTNPNAPFIIQSYIQIFLDSTGTIPIAQSDFVSSATTAYYTQMRHNVCGTFYSNGSRTILVTLGMLALSGASCTMTGSVTLTKIA